jgi:S-adenosylmethionine/arginine decarboxylase-like enzyme
MFLLIIMSWGYHLVVDSSKCLRTSIRCNTLIGAFARTLVNDIDMVAYGDPQIVHFGSGNKAGYTLVQLIETSNITAHFVEETNDMYLDVFSCKPFDPKTVVSLVDLYFSPISKNIIFFERRAGQNGIITCDQQLK